MNKSLFVEKQGAIATLYINRPEKKNAFNLEMWNEFPSLISDVEQDDSVKVLIIRGIDETVFAAGADISEFKTLRSTPEGEQHYNEVVMRAEAALMNLSKPTIAMIQKYCVGGGCILALACDMRFSAESGIFAITPAKIGIIYTFSGTKNLVDLIGPARAKDILYSGRELGAEEAYQFGLVDRVYSNQDILAKTYEYAHLLTMRAQRTIKGAKTIIKEIMSGAAEESEEVNRLIVGSYGSKDYKEGVAAFLEKRQPQFMEN